MSLVEDIKRDYDDDIYTEEMEMLSVFKRNLFETFIWFNRYGNKIDIITIDDSYFKNICRILVKKYYFTFNELEFLKEKRNEYRKKMGITSKRYKLVVKGDVVFEYSFYPESDKQIAIGLLYSIDGKLDKLPAVEMRRIILEKDYDIIIEEVL